MTGPYRYRNRPRSDWERYAVVPLAVLNSSLSHTAKICYCYCDARQGDAGRPAKGVDACARAVHMSPTTWKKGIEELRVAGLVSIERNENPGKSERGVEYRLIHNPSRKRTSQGVAMPPDNGKGGRKLKPRDPQSRKREGTYRVGGESAVARARRLKRDGDASESDGRIAQNLATFESPPESDDAAGLGISQVVEEVATVCKPICPNCHKPTRGEYGECCDCPF